MHSSRAETATRRLRWLALATCVVAAPKCLVCLLGYAGLGAALGLAGPELCGAPSGSATPWGLSLVAAAIASGGIGFFLILRSRPRSTVSEN